MVINDTSLNIVCFVAYFASVTLTLRQHGNRYYDILKFDQTRLQYHGGLSEASYSESGLQITSLLVAINAFRSDKGSQSNKGRSPYLIGQIRAELYPVR